MTRTNESVLSPISLTTPREVAALLALAVEPTAPVPMLVVEPKLELTEIGFAEGEVAIVMAAAVAGGQSLQEFIAQAVREGVDKYRQAKHHSRVVAVSRLLS